MSETHEALFALQLVDTEIFALRKAAKALPEEAAQAKRRSETAERESEAARGLVRDAQRFVDQRSLELQTAETVVRRLEAQSLQLKTPTEFEVMQRQIAQKREEISSLETKILEGMDMVDRARLGVGPKEAQAKALVERAAASAAHATTVVARGALRLQECEADWKTKCNRVPADLLARYVIVRDRHGGQGVAEIAADGMCQGCFMLVTRARATQALGGEPVACNNCERFLVVR